MSPEERREKILLLLSQTQRPLSGTSLAKTLRVSRQVVVQDIALLRAVNKNILSTNKGYIIYQDERKEDVFRSTIKVMHTEEQILDELNTIVDLGGHILDVVIEHEIYGQITCDLIIHSRQDALQFVNQCKESHAKGLSVLTDGKHYHTIEAGSQELLCEIEKALMKKGYLLS